MKARPSDTSRAVFVVLDGLDGCGKTTQAARLVAALGDRRGAGGGQPGTGADAAAPLHLREPGSTPAGERIRQLVLDPDVSLGGGTLALLFAAARRETLEQLVAPALEAGRDVVIERFHASTFAYQGGADGGSGGVGGFGERGEYGDDALLDMLQTWAGFPVPTVEIVLDIDPEDSFARAMAREGGGRDRFESRGLEFQERVARGMREYVERVPRAIAVDGRGTEDEVAERVLVAVFASEEAARA